MKKFTEKRRNVGVLVRKYVLSNYANKLKRFSVFPSNTFKGVLATLGPLAGTAITFEP